MGISAFAAITFGLLTLSLITLWIPKRSFYNLYKGLDLWVLLFIFSLGFGLSANFVHVVALIPIIVLGVSCKFLGDKSYKRLARSISPILILVISVGMIAHLIPGFSNPIIISNLVITEGAIPFTLYLNFDKSLVGLFILGFCHKRLSSKNDWLNMAKNIYLQVLLLILVVMVTSLAIKYVQLEIKFPPSFPVWAWVNLLFVCTAEEAFFRGFLQKYLVNYFKEVKYGSLGGILLASLLFGFAHYAGGINLIFLATIAGLGYGWIYYSNRTIESAILAHFSLNVIHFIFFTYPALA